MTSFSIVSFSDTAGVVGTSFVQNAVDTLLLKLPWAPQVSESREEICSNGLVNTKELARADKVTGKESNREQSEKVVVLK